MSLSMATGRRVIRPPDPAIVGPTLTYMPIGSPEAVRRLAHLVFRDAHTALDLTYGRGGFWRAPLSPGLLLTTSSLDPAMGAELRLDFTQTGLPDGCYDWSLLDPPHVADGGAAGILAARYGTIRGTAALRDLITAGVREAWRLADVGILVKVADHAHGGRLLALSDWVKAAVPVAPYAILHTYRASYLRDPKHRVERTPRSNGAIWMAIRRDGERHHDFDREYRRQEGRP